MGFFCLDLQHTGDVVFGVTGVGITPVLPMIAELAARPESGRVLLYWGNRHAARSLLARRARARCQADIVAPRRRDLPHRRRRRRLAAAARGRITRRCSPICRRCDKPVFYLVGNGAMIKELKAALQERGVDRKRQIRNEAFFG